MRILRYCSFGPLFPLFIGGALCAEATKQLTLETAVAEALASHQLIQAAGAHLSGIEGLRLQAGFRPNPQVFLQTENWRFTGEPGFEPGRDLDVYAYMAQPLETGGKRGLRITAAEDDLRVAELEKQALEWSIRQEVRQSFFRALLAQKQLEILLSTGRNFQQIVDYHHVRVEQGAMAEADLIRVQLEQERLSVAFNSAQVEAERARVNLLRAMGTTNRELDFELVEPPAAGRNSPPLDLKALLERAQTKRPEVLLGEANVMRAEAQVAGQKALVKPDWNVLFGYKRTSGYDTILAGVSVPLPVFNRNQGNILHSSAEVDRARFLLRAAKAQIEAEVNSALVGIRRRRAMLREMEKGLVERSEQSWRISMAAYREGGTDLLRLLDAERVRNEVQLIFVRTQMDYQLSVVELENAVGEENLSLAEDLIRVE